MIRALIVEDVPLVRRGIRLFLQNEKDIEVVGEAGDGPEAVARIAELRPDLVFLDVQMPGFDGFEVLARSTEHYPRAVIFITAHADYALRAFENNAVSYLLKPIDPARFAEVLGRARLLLRPTGADTEPGDEAALRRHSSNPDGGVLSAQMDADRRLTRLLVKQADRFVLIKTEEIDWISATGEYASLHTGRGSWLLRMSLAELAERLDEDQFARIHRCTIVNLDRIREIQPRSHGDCDVVLEGGNVLRLSRNYRDAVFSKGA
jgi:two-component system, LytTR family, response regulator